MKDYRKRKWRTIYGKSRIYILRRLRCSHCKKLHTEIPDKLLPYKRYEMKAIEAIFNRKGAACVASERTKKRWIRWCERFLKTFLLFFIRQMKVISGKRMNIKIVEKLEESGWLTTAVLWIIRCGKKYPPEMRLQKTAIKLSSMHPAC